MVIAVEHVRLFFARPEGLTIQLRGSSSWDLPLNLNFACAISLKPAAAIDHSQLIALILCFEYFMWPLGTLRYIRCGPVAPVSMGL
jgi:hypothetical protein